MKDPEIAAMAAVSDALSELDAVTQRRVLRWAHEKFAGTPAGGLTGNEAIQAEHAPAALRRDEIPGIARLSEGGDLRITVRDLKAKSANDAAVRLSHIAIRAYTQLTGQRSVSSKGVIVPLLKSWRIYDGNTRMTLAKQKGIIRSGDMLELDVHAEAEADTFMADALNNTIDGSWSPGKTRRAVLKGRQDSDQ